MASAISSFTEFTGRPEYTASATGPVPNCVIGVNDLIGSYGSFRYIEALNACATEINSSV